MTKRTKILFSFNHLVVNGFCCVMNIFVIPNLHFISISVLRLLALRELRTLRVAKGVQVYSVAGGMQVYSVTNYSTCYFLLHLQLSKNYIKQLNLDSTFHSTYLSNGQTYNNCDLARP